MEKPVTVRMGQRMTSLTHCNIPIKEDTFNTYGRLNI